MEFCAGIGTGMITGYLTYQIIGDYKKKSPEDSGGYGHLFVIYAGFSLGTHVGVYLAGTVGDETGSYFAALGGSILGLLGGVILTPLSFGISLFILPLIGPIYAFNLTREYDEPPISESALIHSKSGNFNVNLPSVSFQMDPSDKRSSTPIVRLINIEF